MEVYCWMFQEQEELGMDASQKRDHPLTCQPSLQTIHVNHFPRKEEQKAELYSEDGCYLGRSKSASKKLLEDCLAGRHGLALVEAILYY